MEEIKSHGIFSFKDEKTQPDPVFEYPSNIANSGIPLVIDNGKNFLISSIDHKMMHYHFIKKKNPVKLKKVKYIPKYISYIWDRGP